MSLKKNARVFLCLLCSSIIVFMTMGCGDSTSPESNATPSPNKEQMNTPQGSSSSFYKEIPTPSPLPEPNNGFIWNGKKLLRSIFNYSDTKTGSVIGELEFAISAEEWEYERQNTAGIPNKQYACFEEAIEAGNVGAIVCKPDSVDMLQTVVEQAAAAGILVIFVDAEPTAYKTAACIYTRQELVGMFAVEMAGEWMLQSEDTKFDDAGVPVAIDVNDENRENRYRSNAIRDGVNANEYMYLFDENASYLPNGREDGYNWAEYLIDANPRLRIFICYEPLCCYGVCDFLKAYCKERGTDLRNYCVICCQMDSETRALYEEAVSDPSSTAFKGYIVSGDQEENGSKTIGKQICKQIIDISTGDGDWGEPYYTTVSAWATFTQSSPWKTWRTGDVNPARKYRY